MADKITYKGGTTVVGHSGNEIQLVLPAKGSFHKFPRWWNKKGTIAYVDAAIFLVTLDSGVKVRLVVPASVAIGKLLRFATMAMATSPSLCVKVLLSVWPLSLKKATTLYKEYQFSKISGGSVLTRTVQPYPVPET